MKEEEKAEAILPQTFSLYPDLGVSVCFFHILPFLPSLPFSGRLMECLGGCRGDWALARGAAF